MDQITYRQKGTDRTVTIPLSELAEEAASLLEWGYGKVVGFIMRDRMFMGQRPGQAFMNTLFEYDPGSYVLLAGSSVDPFYVDAKIPAALDRLTSK